MAEFMDIYSNSDLVSSARFYDGFLQFEFEDEIVAKEVKGYSKPLEETSDLLPKLFEDYLKGRC